MYYHKEVINKRPTHYVDGKQEAISRIIMGEQIGRKLTSGELVHHINKDTRDNRIENLMVVTRGQHKKIHDSIGMKTRLQKKYFFDKDELIGLYHDDPRVYKIAEVYNCNEMTIERALRIFLNCNSLKKYKKEKGLRYKSKNRMEA